MHHPKQLDSLFTAGMLGDLSDGQLLQRSLEAGDGTAQAAFTALMNRHGSMVLRVCRQILGDSHDAQDAFQATFLVLAHKAGSIRKAASVASWLHGVALRVSTRIKASAHQRRTHERRAALARADRQEHRSESYPELHEELARLPERYREPLVLCYLEGLSTEEVAWRLGCPKGTVLSRLSRGRERLLSRLTRRGLAPTLGELGAGVTPEAVTVLPPAALIEATVRAAFPAAASAVVSGPMIQLTRGVIRSMLLMKTRTVVASIMTIVALVAGARSFLQETPSPHPQPNLAQVRVDLGARRSTVAAQPESPAETGPPPQDLIWTDVAPLDRWKVIEQLAGASRGNYEKIKTWRGSYSYLLRQHLDRQFVSQILTGKSGAQGQPEPLIQEFDSVLSFTVDFGLDAIYRDVETSRMRFLKVGTDEEVKVPNTAAADHRSIVTPEVYLSFDPKARATSAFLPDHPEAQMKRRAERFPVQEVRMREGGTIDPRDFFKVDPGNFFWTGFELYGRAFRGELGAAQKKVVEERLKISQAEGPGGRWYRDQVGFTNIGGSMLWITTLWSPEAGYNPVSMIRTLDKPDGKLESKDEWQWKVLDGIYVPATIKESAYRATGGTLSKEQTTKAKECVLNQPLKPHQFDEGGLGLDDGDLILNHLERVAYIVRGGDPVKLADFGAGSVLRPTPAPARPPSTSAPSPTISARPRSQTTGRIYTTASLGTDAAGRPIASVVAVDPENGEATKVFDDSPGRLRISPDGQTAAFVSGEWWSNLPPAERMRNSLWTRKFTEGSKPERVLALDDGTSAGGLPIWAPDGRQIILSVGTRDETRQLWVNETFRVNADGSGRTPLRISDQDSVQDWSPDGQWIVTTSSRNAKIGWQLYLMKPDGTDQRQVTEGGNPFYVRFSPDSRRLLYTDGPAQDRRGIWVVELDGKGRRRIFETGRDTASACWSPDGQRIAVAINGSTPEDHARLEVVNLDGTHRTLLTMPTQRIADMPDWR